MKREDVSKIFEGATEEQINQILNINSADIGNAKQKAETERDGYKAQLNTAQTALKEFEGVDVKELQGKIDKLNNDLATGTVVPANYGEFLAVLGDNKREPEIVSPRSEIKKAMQEVLASNSGSDQPIEVYLILDGDTIYKTVVNRNKQMTKAMGVNPLGL